jgi:adenine/guanine phosphoribosyltransferase-like PRPP-binding protein
MHIRLAALLRRNQRIFRLSPVKARLWMGIILAVAGVGTSCQKPPPEDNETPPIPGLIEGGRFYGVAFTPQKTLHYPLYQPNLLKSERRVDINFQDDPLTLSAAVVPLTQELNQIFCDVLVCLGFKTVPLGILLAKERRVPWIIVRDQPENRPSFNKIVYRSGYGKNDFQSLYLTEDQKNLIQGQNVVLLSDVLSSSEQVVAAVKLMQDMKANVSAILAPFTEGKAIESPLVVRGKPYSLVTMGVLPVIPGSTEQP